jgi:hypothetical protein
VEGCCESSNGTSGSIKFGGILEHLSKKPKKDSASVSQSVSQLEVASNSTVLLPSV